VKEKRFLGELVLSVVDRDGSAKDVRARSGEALMPFLRDQIDVTIGTCGGQVSCGTCLVLLAGDWDGRVSPPGADEGEMLEALGAEAGARLACQLVLPEQADGLSMTIAPEI
jgi:2Fe-2S ferredoxin